MTGKERICKLAESEKGRGKEQQKSKDKEDIV